MNNKLYNIIESEKSELFNTFQLDFPMESLANAVEISGALAKVVIPHIISRIIEHRNIIFGTGTEAAATTNYNFGYKGQQYRILYAPDLAKPDTLQFIVAPIIPESPTQHVFSPLPFDAPPIGQYRHINFLICTSITIENLEFLRALTQGLLSTAYMWLSDKVTALIKQMTESIQTSLYDYVRAMSANYPEAMDGFLFSCLFKDRDFVIQDQHATEAALRLAQPRAPHFQRAAENLVLQMFGEVVPADDSIIIEAFKETRPRKGNEFVKLNFDSNSGYYRKNPAFFDSLVAVWGHTVLCYPITLRRGIKLVAFFPEKHVRYLLPFMKAHKLELERRALEQVDVIRQHLLLLENNGIIVSENEISSRDSQTNRGGIWGAFFGELLGRLFKTFSEP